MSCGETFQEQAEREKKERNERLEAKRAVQQQTLEQLQSKYDADALWNQNDDFFLFEIQERLIRNDRKPLIGIAGLWDIDKVGKSYKVHLMSEYGRRVDPNPLHIVLDCEKSLLGNPQKPRYRSYDWRGLPKYVFVARIHSVKRAENVDVSVLSDSTTVDTRPSFIADGECIDLKSTAEPKSKPEAN